MRRIALVATGLAVCLLLGPVTSQAQLRVPVNVVLMNVTVTNSKNEYDYGIQNKGFVSGLNQNAFTIYDDTVPQTISFFNNEDTPASVGIVVDTSTFVISRRGQDLSMLTMAAGVSSFIEHSNSANEYFLVTSGSGSHLAVDWTGDGSSILRAITAAKPKGTSALYDACYFGLDKVLHGKNAKHVLLVFATGNGKSTQHTYKEIKEDLRASDALLYFLTPPNTSSFFGAPTEVQDLARDTGGRYLDSGVQSPKVFALSAELIALEIRHQYMIGFVPKESTKGHEWHSLKVGMNRVTVAPRDLQHLFTRSRGAYRTSSTQP